MGKHQQLTIGLVLVAAISAVAAFPLVNSARGPKAPVREEAPADEPDEKIAEVKPAPAKKATAPPKRKVTRWAGGGDVVVGSGSPCGTAPGRG